MEITYDMVDAEKVGLGKLEKLSVQHKAYIGKPMSAACN